jgi:predicted nucleotidyltransferase
LRGWRCLAPSIRDDFGPDSDVDVLLDMAKKAISKTQSPSRGAGR